MIIYLNVIHLSVQSEIIRTIFLVEFSVSVLIDANKRAELHDLKLSKSLFMMKYKSIYEKKKTILEIKMTRFDIRDKTSLEMKSYFDMESFNKISFLMKQYFS